jgi:3,4-dihydroxy 2-butanone 4-phosphate synthase / GTP cyclohydrolase II
MSLKQDSETMPEAASGGADEISRAALHDALSPIDDVIEDMRNGRMVILVDDEDRENEGDLVIPAQMATPEAVNFMARFGRGLICLALSDERVTQLGLGLMSQNNRTRHQTAFTVSIEAREGVTTGISASDRARTIAVAIDPSKGAEEIVTPGHVFPLVARDGGVLVRAGHTEAAVDLSRLAGLTPAGVICEIMNDDGTMARLPDLVKFAQFHGLKVATIADLIAYRLRNDRLVERLLDTDLNRRHGGRFRLLVYANQVSYAEHVALIKGDISGPEPVLVRMHSLNILDDLLHDDAAGRESEIESAIRLIGEEGRGVVVLIREPAASYFTTQVRRRRNITPAAAAAIPAEASPPPGERHLSPVLRDYGVGAQILLDLGVREMILLTNVKRAIAGLEGYGLKVVGRRPIPKIDV